MVAFKEARSRVRVLSVLSCGAPGFGYVLDDSVQLSQGLGSKGEKHGV